VVLTPVLGAALFRRRVGRNAWIAVGLATVGLGVLSLQGFSLSLGDSLTLGAALLYAFHILGLGSWSEPADAYGMATVQMFVIAVTCTLAALPGGLTVPGSLHLWWPIVFTGLVEGALALLVQTWAQAHLSPTRAAIIMTGELVFAALFAITLGGEPLTWRLVGGLPVVAAMLLAEQGAVPVAHLAEGP
jgi:drug/metabolite transporter (DMT)-like permease